MAVMARGELILNRADTKAEFEIPRSTGIVRYPDLSP